MSQVRVLSPLLQGTTSPPPVEPRTVRGRPASVLRYPARGCARDQPPGSSVLLGVRGRRTCCGRGRTPGRAHLFPPRRAPPPRPRDRPGPEDGGAMRARRATLREASLSAPICTCMCEIPSRRGVIRPRADAPAPTDGSTLGSAPRRTCRRTSCRPRPLSRRSRARAPTLPGRRGRAIVGVAHREHTGLQRESLGAVWIAGPVQPLVVVAHEPTDPGREAEPAEEGVAPDGVLLDERVLGVVEGTRFFSTSSGTESLPMSCSSAPVASSRRRAGGSPSSSPTSTASSATRRV